MTNNALMAINQSMQQLDIDYSFGINSKNPITYPYCVGEYSEIEVDSEDGLQETTFMITAFSRTSWADLETIKNNIEQYFDQNGRSFMADDGSGIVIMYNNAIMVPKEDPELKSLQINLIIKEWKV